jgi:hypothetical protein
MERRKRANRNKLIAVFAVILGISAAVPTMALGQQDPVGDLVRGLTKGLGLDGGAPDSPAPNAGVPGVGTGYQPPLHGTNPHGQGAPVTADISPSNNAPLPGDPESSEEDLTVGSSRGEQDAAGNYHGRVAVADLHLQLLNLLNLPNIPIIEVEAAEGEDKQGPLDPVQTGLLDQICGGLGQAAGCITVLSMRAQADNAGSTNHFETAGVTLPFIGTQVSAVRSDGEVRESGPCQTATGSSGVANAMVLGVITASAANASSTATACNNGTPSTASGDSEVLNLFGAAIPLPTQGCADGTPDSVGGIPALLPTVCNADDTNGTAEAVTQDGAPYNVREALTAFLLGGIAIPGLLPIKVTTAGPEAHAVAPAVTNPPTTNPPGGGGNNGGGGGGGNNGGGGDDGGPAGGPTATVAQGSGGELAFTGTNVLVLGLIGLALIFGGVGVARASAHHRRATA